MTPDEWRKKREEEKKQETGKAPATSSTTETESSGGTVKRMTPSEWKTKKSSTSFDYWAKASTSLLNEIYSNANSWSYKEKHSDYSTRISELLGQADNWRKQYAGNQEAVSYINSVVAALGDTKKQASDIADYYSQWETEDQYNFWDSRNTTEKRQQLYTDNQSRIKELEDFYDSAYAVESWYSSYQMNPDAWDANVVNRNLDIYNRLKNEYGSLENIEAELEQLYADNTNYERGNYNQYGQMYGNKTIDDYTAKYLSNPEFIQAASNREYGNASVEDLMRYNTLNDTTTWTYDVDGTLRSADGTVIVEDGKGGMINPDSIGLNTINDRVGMYINATDEERGMAFGTGMGPLRDVFAEGAKRHWELLSEDELTIYYGLLKQQGQAAADKFLDEIQTTLDMRDTQKSIERNAEVYDESNFLEKILLNAATVPAQVESSVFGGIEDAIALATGNDINPYSAAHGGMHYSQTIRGKTAQELDEGADPNAFYTWGDLYQTGMSVADSIATMYFGGSTLLALNAAENEAYRLYAQGATNEQIAQGAFTVGAAEYLSEALSIGNLKKIANMKSPQTLAQWFKTLLVQGGIEGSEELLTEVANTLSNHVIMGSQSDWSKLVEENDGDVSAANWQKFLDVARATLSGIISGGMSSLLVGTGSYHRNLAQFNETGSDVMKSGDVEALKALAMDVSGAKGSLARQAKRMTSETATGTGIGKVVAGVKNRANRINVGRVAHNVGEGVTYQNLADIKKSLTRKGFSAKEADRIGGYLHKAANGGVFTTAEADEVAGDQRIVAVLRDVVGNPDSTIHQRTQRFVDAVAGKAPTASTASETAPKGNTGIPSETSYTVSEGGQTKLDGNAVQLRGLRKLEDGSIVVATADDQTADPSEIEYSHKGQALVFESYASPNVHSSNPVIDKMPVADRSALAMSYDPSSGIDGKLWVTGSNEAYWYGFEGIDHKTLPTSSFAKYLPQEQITKAYALGRAAAEASAKAQSAGIQAAYEQAVEKLGGKEGAKVAVKKAGKVVLEHGIREATMTKQQKASYELAQVVAKAVGTNIHVYHGVREYGKYDRETGEIWLNINANFNGQSMMAFTLGHELAHMAKQWSPAKFKKFADYLLDQYGKKGVSVETLIQEQIANAKRNNLSLDEHEAYEEVIADACQRMLLDTNAVEKMAKFREENPRLWRQIVNTIKEFIAKIRKAFEGAAPDSVEAQHFKELDAAAKQILENLFVDMVMDAGEHMSTIRNAFGEGTVVEVNENGEFTLAKGEDSDGAKKFLYNDYTWERGGRDTLREALRAEGYSEEDIKAALTIMDGKHELVKRLETQFQEQARINQVTVTTDLKDGHSVLSALVSNGDYPVNIDLLMVCKKRKAYQRVINRLCETGLIKQATVDALAIAEINKILGKYGFETACLGCFVESRRLRIQEWAETICTEWNSEVKKRNPNAKPFGFGKGEATLTPDEVMQLVGELESGGAKNEKGNLNLGQGSAVKRMGVLLDKVPSLRRTLSIEDLITPDGLTALRSFDSNLFSMVKSRYGSNSPKFVQEFNPYNHELAMYGKVPSEYKSLREYLYAIGGARMQSFSDFIVENWFDYCQIVADLAARKLPMHTYTKEISLVKLFGLTGIKINMSLIPDIDRSLGEDYAGLTRNADGELELIWADKDRFKATGGKSYMQSINFNDAIALQNDPRYSANVGTIAIGVSDKQILMMLDDARIRMIIPYHSSGMNPIFADLMGTSFYKDYTMVQNTTVKQLYDSKGRKVSIKLDKTQTGKLTSGFQFNEVLQELGDARAAAEAYKEWCADASKHTITINGETYTAELTPKFNDFSGHQNYYKLLEDFNTYDCITEQAAPQGDVQQIYPEGFEDILTAELSAQEKHRQKQVKNQAFDKAMDEIEDYLRHHTKADTVFYAHQRGIKLSDKDKKLNAEDKKKLTALKRGTKMSMPKVSDSEYMAAVNRGDMEAAQRMVDAFALANGYIPVARYHQTLSRFTEFNTDNPVAGRNDSETPNGIFFKANDHDIGIGGDIQMKMYLKASNMLHFADRKEANAWYRKNIPGYDALQKEMDKALKPFLDQLEAIEEQEFDTSKSDEEVDALFEEEERVIEEMRKVEDSYRGKLRELLNQYFLSGNSGYDGIELDYDGHRWVNGKREDVHTYIVFHPSQAKSSDPVTYDDSGKVIPLSERFNSGKKDIRYSLPKVAPVQPSTSKWSRTHDTDEVKAQFPELWDVAADSSEVRNPTQISGTVKSYRKIYDYLKSEGFSGTILDASSGLGYGTRAGIEEYGFDVDDIEPYPDKSYSPKYTDYSTLHKKYDVIISNAVLNVLPQDQRDALVVKMASMLNPGGRIFINVRGRDVESASSKVAIDSGLMEYYISNTGSYQKGFTKQELVAYLEDALGPGYRVNPTSLFGAVSAVVTKVGDKNGIDNSQLIDENGAIPNSTRGGNGDNRRTRKGTAETARGFTPDGRANPERTENSQKNKEWGDLTPADKKRIVGIVDDYIGNSNRYDDLFGLLCSYVHRTEYNITARMLKKAIAMFSEQLFADAMTMNSAGFEIRWAIIGNGVTGLFLDLRSAAGVKFKAPNSRGLSPRQLLADAFEEMVQTPQERQMIDEYRANISKVEDVQERLKKVRAKIHELTVSKGDKSKIAALNKTASELAALIDSYDRKLLEMEGSKPLRDVLTRAKQAAYRDAKQRGEKLMAEYRQQVSERFDRGVESRKKTAMRAKIRKTIRDLDKILNRGDKKRNVKEGMKGFVEEALASAEILFTENYGNEDMIRNGVEVEMTPEEEKYMTEARAILAELYNLPSGSYEAWAERQGVEESLKSKLAYRMGKLKDVFYRERLRLNKTKVADVLSKLADAYAKLETSEYAYVSGAYNEAIHQYLKTLQEEVGGATIRDMSLNQLELMHTAYTMVLHSVKKANEMFTEGWTKRRDELANGIMFEVKDAGGVHGRWSAAEVARNRASWNNTKPIYAAERIGSETFKQLWAGLFKGQYNWAVDMEEAKAFRQKLAEKYGFKNWDMEKMYTFTSASGLKFQLNLNQIMSIYAYSKREQAHDHLTKGGFVFGKDTEVIVNKHGIKVTYYDRSATAYKLSDELVEDIVSMLDTVPGAKQFVDEMQDYLSTTMGEKGNEVSMKLYGVKLFNEAFYFPLRSAGQYMERAKEADLKKQQGQVSIVNSSFTHATKPKANNPVVLEGFMDVWASHVNEMSMYHSMVLPMEDFRRVYNYSSPNMEGQDSVSVNSVIENAYGPEATGYIDQLYKELNGGAVTDPRETAFKERIGKFKKAAVMLSSSVVVQQFSAIGRAYALIDPKYFIGAKVDKHRQAAAWEEMKRYAPVAIIKEMGGFDTHTGGSAKDYLLAEEYGKGERISGLIKDEQYRSEIMGLAPAKADELTWCAIWEAVKRETKAKHPELDVKSEEFLKAAGERFSEVIEKTQVYDSVLARSANMRSKNGLMQMATAFMAEPTTTVNMIEDALRKKDKKYIARTFASVFASIVINNALASLVYAMRDDDDDETFLEKYTQALVSGMLDDLNPMTYYPFLKDVWSLLQGYDVERSDMSVVSDVTDAVKRLATTFAKFDEDMDEEEMAEYYKEIGTGLMGLLDAGCTALGIPEKNVRREITAIVNTFKTFSKTFGSTTWNSFVDAIGSSALDSIPIVGLFGGESRTDKLYDAIVSGDTTYLARLKAGYKSEDSYNAAVRKALRENDPRIHQAALAGYNGDPSERVRIARLIIADGFSQDNVVAAINAEINNMKPDEPKSDPKAKGFYTAEDFAREIANGDQAAANAAKVDVIQTAQKNGKSAEEATKSFVSSAKAELKDLFLIGRISEQKAINALTTYCDMDEADAIADVQYWAFKNDYPDVFVDDQWFDTYYEKIADSGIEIDVYMEYRNAVAGITGENKKSGRMSVINSLPITNAQKDALYLAEGWAASKLNEAPWH